MTTVDKRVEAIIKTMLGEADFRMALLSAQLADANERLAAATAKITELTKTEASN